MTKQAEGDPSRRGVAFYLAAVLVVLYALGAAWFVAIDERDPDPLRLERTDDGAGIVVSGAVADTGDRDAVIAAVSDVTDASVIVARIVIDPDAEPVSSPRATAAELAAALSDAELGS